MELILSVDRLKTMLNKTTYVLFTIYEFTST